MTKETRMPGLHGSVGLGGDNRESDVPGEMLRMGR